MQAIVNFLRILACVSASGLAAAQAQIAPPDPLDASAASAPLDFQSSFARYRVWSEGPVMSWREANDQVGRIGGWRVYAREAYATDAAAPSASEANPPSSDHVHEHGDDGGADDAN